MSASNNLFHRISILATPEELSLLAVVYNDHFTRTALAARDMKALSRVYQVSIYSYEDHLKEKYGVIFRNRPGRFEVIQNNKPIYSVPDDVLGTCGNAAVLALKKRDNCPIAAHYPSAMSGKYRPAPDDVLALVDVQALSQVHEQILERWPAASQAVEEMTGLVSVPKLERNAHHDMHLINLLCEIYTVLRCTGEECFVDVTASRFLSVQFAYASRNNRKILYS